MKRIHMKCPYCGSAAVYRPARMVYGDATINRGGHLYVCSRWPDCDAYVYAHKNSGLPMGTLANGPLRHKRILAHRALSDLQKHYGMNRSMSYLWLQVKFDLSPEQAHIGKFSEKMCERVISKCRQDIGASALNAA